MSSQNLIPFRISSVDSLGQGVSKITDKVTFIPKTLPGEEGKARLLSAKSKVAFGELVRITQASPRRITPVCEHFKNCSGCHYLHTDYEYELKLKLLGMKNLFHKYPDLKPQLISSTTRLGYRNRIQLHYDLKEKKLGFRNARSNKILEVPHCQIGRKEVMDAVKELYTDNNWLRMAPTKTPRGHVEIYFDQNQLKITWNRPYAEGGFTQVHSEMNEKLKAKVKEVANSLKPRFVLDLFAGNGNLSNELSYEGRLCIDMYQQQMPEDFYSLNLYGKTALSEVAKKLAQTQVDLLILDPPRSGLKNLDEWVKMSRPQSIIYVSCDPHTQIRDISPLSGYEIKDSYLLDLFPSTFHFETMLFLERKN